MKIQHLESIMSYSNANTVLDEIMDCYVIIINALSCLSKQDRWITANRVTTRNFPRGEEKSQKRAKSHNREMERVALNLSDIILEYEATVVKKGNKFDFEAF